VSGTLYVVATPIGNLEDITLRALRVLREVAVIAAEDTRRTAKLLTHYGINTSTVSFHAHNARTRIPQFLGRLERGDSIAVVSDAGTPGISDPGLELVQACIDKDIAIDPIPGASAVLTALVASGFPTAPVTFLGFPPNRSKDRTRWWSDISENRSTVVFFEAPHRIMACLTEAAMYLGIRPLVVGRELTKVHQEFLRGPAETVVKCLKETRGEFTVVIGPAQESPDSLVELPEEAILADEFRHLTESVSLTRRQAIAELARKYDRPSREIYARLEAAKTGLS
jgi:16S rRNA (cytidine1402-2'-O)-methyltransferase